MLVVLIFVLKFRSDRVFSLLLTDRSPVDSRTDRLVLITTSVLVDFNDMLLGDLLGKMNIEQLFPKACKGQEHVLLHFGLQFYF